MREFFIAIFKIKADIRMNKTTLNSQKEKHSMLSLRRATKERKVLIADVYIFRSTLSLRRATRSRGSPRILVRDFYPRSPCGERLHIGRGCVMIHRISIHALLAESDTTKVAGLLALIYISIHALLAESDCARGPLRAERPNFLSTLSLRRATPASIARAGLCIFYPRS